VEQAGLLLVAGRLQISDGVVHVIARQLRDLSPLLADMRMVSRDFC
jgi:precorrin isomerase